jgi:hypothetical protein
MIRRFVSQFRIGHPGRHRTRLQRSGVAGVLGVLGLSLGVALACMPDNIEDLAPFQCEPEDRRCPGSMVCGDDLMCRASCGTVFEFDGICSEGLECAPGTDPDCQRTWNDTCGFAFDGACDEPTFCELGTDQTDCDGAPAGGVCSEFATQPSSGMYSFCTDGNSCSVTCAGFGSPLSEGFCTNYCTSDADCPPSPGCAESSCAAWGPEGDFNFLCVMSCANTPCPSDMECRMTTSPTGEPRPICI